MTPLLHLPLSAIALSLVVLSGCSSKESRIASGIDKAEAFVRVADWDKAGVEVRNVLQIEPKTARAQYVAGKIAEGQKDIRRAYGHYLKAVELQPSYPDAQAALARLYLLAGDVPKATTATQQVLATTPDHAGARAIDAALKARTGNVAQALAEAERLVGTVKPVPVEAAMLLAGLQTNAGRRSDALVTIDKALADHPKDLGLLRVGAEIAASDKDRADASSLASGYFRRAVQEGPKSHELWQAWANMHAQRKELDAAEKVLRESVAVGPDDSARRVMLLEFLASVRGFPTAEQEYRSAIAAQPREASLRFGLVNLYRGAGKQAEAQRTLQEIIDVDGAAPAAATARGQLAAYKLAAGRLGEARGLVAEVLKANPRDNTGLLLRGRLHLFDGKPRDAIIDLRSVVRDQPGSREAVALLAQAHRLAGEASLAREVIGDALKFRPDDAEMRLLLASELATAKDYKAADAEIDSVIQAQPRLVRAYDAKAQLAIAQGNLDGAERAFAALKAALPDDPVGNLRAGRLMAERGRGEQALKEYQAGSAKANGSLPLYLAAVGQLTSLKRYAEAHALIAQKVQTEPGNVLHVQLEGDVALNAGDLARAEAAYRRLAEADPKAAAGPLGLARVQTQRGNVPAAVEVLAQAEKANPDNVQFMLARAELLGRANRIDDAIAVYETALKKAPDNDTVVNNLAYLLAEVKQDKASLERALELAGRFVDSGNASYLDSLGWIHYRLGQYDRAIPLLDRAVALEPRAPLLAMHLGKALVKGGDAARGREILQKVVESKAKLPQLDEARQMLTQR